VEENQIPLSENQVTVLTGSQVLTLGYVHMCAPLGSPYS
jgi:hypothetical protein